MLMHHVIQKSCLFIFACLLTSSVFCQEIETTIPPKENPVSMPNPFSFPGGICTWDFKIVPAETAGQIYIDLETEFYTSGYELISKEIQTEENNVYVYIDVKIPDENEVVLPVITPFQNRIGEIQLSDGSYKLIPFVNQTNNFRSYIPFSIEGSNLSIERAQISEPEVPENPYVNPEPVPFPFDYDPNEFIGIPMPTMVYTNGFDEESVSENGLHISVPGNDGEYILADVEFGEIPVLRGDDRFTNGYGISAELNAGEGVMFYSAPISVEDDLVYLRMSVRTRGESVSIGLGGLDADSENLEEANLDGAMGFTLLNNSQRIHFGYLEAFCKPERGTVFPVFQVVNNNDENPVTVYLDNLEVYRIPATSFAKLIEWLPSTDTFLRVGETIYTQ